MTCIRPTDTGPSCLLMFVRLTSSEARRVRKECTSRCDWSPDVFTSDLVVALLPGVRAEVALDDLHQADGRGAVLPVDVRPVDGRGVAAGLLIHAPQGGVHQAEGLVDLSQGLLHHAAPARYTAAAVASAGEVLHRVHRPAVDACLEVEVRAGDVAGGADGADTGALLDAHADPRGDRRHVRVQRRQPATVGDGDVLAVRAAAGGGLD